MQRCNTIQPVSHHRLCCILQLFAAIGCYLAIAALLQACVSRAATFITAKFNHGPDKQQKVIVAAKDRYTANQMWLHKLESPRNQTRCVCQTQTVSSGFMMPSNNLQKHEERPFTLRQASRNAATLDLHRCVADDVSHSTSQFWVSALQSQIA